MKAVRLSVSINGSDVQLSTDGGAPLDGIASISLVMEAGEASRLILEVVDFDLSADIGETQEHGPVGVPPAEA